MICLLVVKIQNQINCDYDDDDDDDNNEDTDDDYW